MNQCYRYGFLLIWAFSFQEKQTTKKNQIDSLDLVENIRIESIQPQKTISTDSYMGLLGKIQDYQGIHNYEQMLDCCQKSLPLLMKFVSDLKREYGKFDISSIPYIEVGCRYWAVLNSIEMLNALRETINSVKELRDGWDYVVEKAFFDAALATNGKKPPKFNFGFLVLLLIG